ncbi:MAG: hypothetical protein ACPG4T_07685 [Nannocystaceae bacterium]
MGRPLPPIPSRTDTTTGPGTSDTSGETSTSATDGETAPTGEPTTAGPETSDTQAFPCTLDSECPEPIEICVEGVCVDDPEICDYGQVKEVPFIPPNLVFVIDKSTSMFAPENYWDEDGDDLDDDGFQDDDPMQMATPKVSRWSSARKSVDIVGNSPHVGAMLFPSVDAQPNPGPGGCILNQMPEVPVAPGNTEVILATIPGDDAMGLGGGSPATQALEATYAYLQEFTANNVAVLVTDGVPNCAADAPPDEVDLYDESLIPTIEYGRELGIPTVVVGIDISSTPDPQGIVAHDVLNAAAEAGSPFISDHPSEKYFSPRRLDELISLFELPDIVIDCTIELPDWSGDSDVWIRIDGQTFEQLEGDSCGDASGIVVGDGDPLTIDLCGNACALFDELGELEVFLRCEAP